MGVAPQAAFDRLARREKLCDGEDRRRGAARARGGTTMKLADQDLMTWIFDGAHRVHGGEGARDAVRRPSRLV